MIPGFDNQLVISDSTFPQLNRYGISQQAAIHSYSSATKGDISNLLDCTSPGAKEKH